MKHWVCYSCVGDLEIEDFNIGTKQQVCEICKKDQQAISLVSEKTFSYIQQYIDQLNQSNP